MFGKLVKGVLMVNKEGIKVSSSSLMKLEILRDKIYLLRGQKVMLDYDLAEVYGYETKMFNRQVQRNIDRFEGTDFMFQLSMDEFGAVLKCQNGTSKLGWGGTRKMPFAFTEQGIYMLMTVLRGELAVKQSRILIRLFKEMKDYIISGHEIMNYKENLQLAIRVANNTEDITKINKELVRVENRLMKRLNEGFDNFVARSEISPILLDFNKITEQKEFIFLDGEPMKASEFYMEIYNTAKKNIYIIDNYISIKILRHLSAVRTGLDVVVFSDNLGGYLHKVDYTDFKKERPDLEIRFKVTNKLVHDRFVIVDYGTEAETMYHSGASEKDAGSRLMVIDRLDDKIIKNAMHSVIERLEMNKCLKLK